MRVFLRPRNLTALLLLGVVLGVIGWQAARARSDQAAGPRRIAIAVTEKGFEPKEIQVKKGEDLLLVFTRKTDHTCAKSVIVYLDDDRRVQKDLPLNQAVEIRARFGKTGELGYSCGMKMLGGVIKVQ